MEESCDSKKGFAELSSLATETKSLLSWCPGADNDIGPQA